MNYLSHLLLAGGSEDALLGSLLGDFVKGSTGGRFNAAISEAILLHRKIDSFSDTHVITSRSRDRISPPRRRFAGIIIDVGYDHFLSRHWCRFSMVDLESFAERVYAVLRKNRDLLPERLSRILPRMIAENWLGGYMHLERVGDALDRIAGRLTRGARFMRAVNEIEDNYKALERDFLAFFPDLVAFCADWKRRVENTVGRSAGFLAEGTSEGSKGR
ncbi:MAG: ACP phosphodiesterase [Hyphomicrobiales bacterium]